MKMIFSFDYDNSLKEVAFDGLTGREYVSSVKDALNIMKLRNIATDFSADVKARLYDDVSDEAYEQMLDTIKCVSGLWHYPQDQEKDKLKYEMNVLTLLANAIELISRQNALLRKYKETGTTLETDGIDK